MRNIYKKITDRNKVPSTFSIPENTRLYCIGDIHGRADLLTDIHKLIIEDAENYSGEKIIVYLGDYIDRGLQSKEVVDLLINKPLPEFKSIYLRGNHEQVLLDFLNVDPGIVVQWFNFGGEETLFSYGVSIQGKATRNTIQELQQQLSEKIPESHLHFFIQSQFCYQLGDYFFVHAGVKAKVALDRQSESDMMWIRDKFLNSDFQFNKMIVHGHSVVEEPEQKKNRIAIDTGAYFSGRLTSLVLDGEQRRFLQTSI